MAGLRKKNNPGCSSHDCCGGYGYNIHIHPTNCFCRSVPFSLFVSANYASISGFFVYSADDPTYTPESVYKSAGVSWVSPGQSLPASWNPEGVASPGRWYSEPFASRYDPITFGNPDTRTYAAYSLQCNLNQWRLNMHWQTAEYYEQTLNIKRIYIDPFGSTLRIFNVGGVGAVNFCSPFLLACGIDPSPTHTGGCDHAWTVS